MTEKEYPIHPSAELFPPMTEVEFAGLKDDMRKNGQSEKIVIWKGLLVDGRHRLRACRELGVEPQIAELHDGIDPWQYVVSHNLHRRHLDKGQRAMVADTLATMRRGEKKADTGIPASPPSQAEAAVLLNVSVDSVQKARKVRKAATPEVIAAVARGELSLNAALEMTKPQQPPATKTPNSGDTPEPSQASVMLDRVGKPIPNHLRPASELAIQLQSTGREVDKFRKLAKDFAAQPGGEWLNLQTIDDEVRSLKNSFQGAQFHAVCPRCHGDGCHQCNTNGFLPEHRKNSL